MANKKISQLTPKGSALAGTDLLEVSVFNGVTYDTKSLTGANVVSGLQPTLFSGTNIKTINSTSLLGSGDIVISTGLTVGTTPITSGTDTRLLYQSAGVLSQSANLTFSATNKLNINNGAGIISIYHDTYGGLVNVPAGKGYLYLQSDSDDIYIDTGAAKKIYFRQGASTYSNFTSTGLSIGYGTTTAAAKLDIKAQGALSTDIAFRVRNSADSANIFQVNGDGSGGFNINAKDIKFGSGSYIQTGSNNTNTILVGFGLYNCALTNDFDGNNKTASNFNHLNIGGSLSTNGTKTLEIAVGTAPTSTGANSIKMYAAQIVVGNAAPHFRTENGGIIKLYQQATGGSASTFVANTSLIANDTATFDGYTIGQVVKALRNTGLLA